MFVRVINGDAIPGVVDAGANIADEDIANSHAVCTGASGGHAVARAPDAMEAVANAVIPGDVVTKVVDAARVVSGASGVVAADERRGEGARAACVASPLYSRCQQ